MKLETLTEFGMIVELSKAEIGFSGSLYKHKRKKRAEERIETFKALLNHGAYMHADDLNDNPIFSNMTIYGSTPFFKEILHKDSSLIKTKMGSMNVLELAVNNFNDDIIYLIVGRSLKLNASSIDRFIKYADKTDNTMKMYNSLEDSEKRFIKIEDMLAIQNGEAKMLRLLERGVLIFDSFVKNKRVQAIVNAVLSTDRKDEIIELGLANEVEALYSDEVKEHLYILG